jgi:hypothetical protein
MDHGPERESYTASGFWISRYRTLTSGSCASLRDLLKQRIIPAYPQSPIRRYFTSLADPCLLRFGRMHTIDRFNVSNPRKSLPLIAPPWNAW